MSIAWLGDTDDFTAWSNRSWKDFLALKQPEKTLVVLPVYGFASSGEEAPLDAEESASAPLLRRSARNVSSRIQILVLPPLRFDVGGSESPAPLSLEPETAHELINLVAKGIRSSGFTKLVFFNTSERNESFLAAAAIDLRANLGLHTYIVHGKALGISGSEVSTAEAERLTTVLGGLFEEIRLHRDPDPIEPSPCARERQNLTEDSIFPPYRPHYLPSFGLAQLREIAATRPDLKIVLPTAAIEQHGPHLPVGVDAVLGQALINEALRGRGREFPALVLPPIVYGKSVEHASFAGTLSIDSRVLRRQVLQIARSMRKLGFRRLRLFNTHGGNTAVLDYVARELREELKMDAGLLRYDFEPQLDSQEKAWGMHADEWETSLMLAAAPESVCQDKAVCEYPARLEDPGMLRPEKAPATFAWLTSDVSESGVLGNPTAASVEKGKRWLSQAGSSIAKALEVE